MLVSSSTVPSDLYVNQIIYIERVSNLQIYKSIMANTVPYSSKLITN